jgi:hypothetical protein
MVTVPEGSENHWRGIRARIAGFGELRAAQIDGRENPAHPLANAPAEYAHVNHRADRCVLPEPATTHDAADADEPQYPPPSRFEGRASD